MQVEMNPREAMFVRHAISVALVAAPHLWDAEQREALGTVECRLTVALDEVLDEALRKAAP